MAKAKKDIEIVLTAIEIDPAAGFAAKSRHIVDATLIWPRVTIAKKESGATLPFDKGNWSSANRNFADCILFKETVQGRFGISFSITEKVSEGLEAALGDYLANGVIDQLGAIAAKTLPAAGKFAEIPLTALAKTALRSKSPKVIAYGSLDLDADKLADEMKLEIVLAAPQAIRKTETRTRGKSTVKTQKTVFPEGAAIGKASAILRII